MYLLANVVMKHVTPLTFCLYSNSECNNVMFNMHRAKTNYSCVYSNNANNDVIISVYWTTYHNI